MTTRGWIGLVIMVAVVAAVVAWLVSAAFGPGQRGPEPVPVTIAFLEGQACQGTPVVVPDRPRVEKNDTVRFTLSNSCGVEVVASLKDWTRIKNEHGNDINPPEKEDPFERNDRWTLPPGQTVQRDLKLKSNRKYGTYKYTVSWTAGGQARPDLDPQMIIYP